MKKPFITICLLLIISVTAWANSTLLIGVSGVVSEGGEDYSDILFFHSFETSATCSSCNADKAGGDFTPSCQVNAAISTSDAPVGSNWLSVTGSYDRQDYVLNAEDNITLAQGRIGFWVRVATWASSTRLFTASYNASNILCLYLWGTDEFSFDYLAGGTGTQYNDTAGNYSTNTNYFIEFRWNPGDAGNDFTLYVNGSAVLSANDASGSLATASNGTISIGDTEGNGGVLRIDNVIISNDPDRDLYALRNATSLD